MARCQTKKIQILSFVGDAIFVLISPQPRKRKRESGVEREGRKGEETEKMC
jgi:hypothetical protein